MVLDLVIWVGDHSAWWVDDHSAWVGKGVDDHSAWVW